jgi:hypothetical protein
MRRQRGETCVTTKWTIPPRRSLKTIFATLRREPLRTQVRVVCSFDTGWTIGLKTSAAACSSALNRRCSAGVGALEAEAEAEPEPEPEAEPPEPDACVPELVLVRDELVVVVFDKDDEADEAADAAELVACASEDVALFTVETTVETTEVGFGGGGGEDEVGSGTFVLVGSGTFVLVGSGTLVLVGSGTFVLVGSGTDVLVGSGTVVVVMSPGGPSASAVGAAIAAAAAQSRIDLALRPLTGIQPRSRANGCG